jgi:hypothetical protein
MLKREEKDEMDERAMFQKEKEVRDGINLLIHYLSQNLPEIEQRRRTLKL